MEITTPAASPDDLADLWVDLAESQRAHDSHILPADNRPRIRQAIASSPLRIASGELHRSTSVGVTRWEAGEDEDTLMARVDCALYEAKDGGRDRVVALDPHADPSEHDCDPLQTGSPG